MHGWQYYGRISIRCTCFSSTNRRRRGVKGEKRGVDVESGLESISVGP